MKMRIKRNFLGLDVEKNGLQLCKITIKKIWRRVSLSLML